MWDWLLSFELLNLQGFLMYWVPLCTTLIGYLFKTVSQFHTDKDKRAQWQQEGGSVKYCPTLTVGTILGRFVVSFIPFVNVLAAFDASKSVLDRFSYILDIPLVRGK